LQFVQKHPNYIHAKKYRGQHNSYLTLRKDANAHGISPTYNTRIFYHIPQQEQHLAPSQQMRIIYEDFET